MLIEIYFILEESTKNLIPTGPWNQLSIQINQLMSESADMKDEISELNSLIKTQSLSQLQQDKSNNELKVVKESLEKRLGEEKQKTLRIANLELEKKRFVDKEKHYEFSIESIRIELDKEAEKNKALQEQLVSVKKDLDHEQKSPYKSSRGKGMLGKKQPFKNRLRTNQTTNTQQLQPYLDVLAYLQVCRQLYSVILRILG